MKLFKPHGTHLSRSQRTTILNGVLILIGLLLMMQLWLLAASITAFLGGDSSILLPAALASVFCLVMNGGLLYYVFQFAH